MKRKVDSILFSLMGDFSDITMDNTDKIQVLKNKIIEKDLYINIEKQVRMSVKIEPGKPPVPEKVLVRKPKLIKSDENVIINFDDDRINVYFNSHCLVQSVENMCQEYYTMLSDAFPLKIRRVALNTDIVCSEYTEQEADIERSRFVVPTLPIYKEKSLKTWQALVETELNEKDYFVPVNVITSAIRGIISRGNDGPKDTLLIHLDINTSPKINFVIPPNKVKIMTGFLFETQQKMFNDIGVDIND